MFKSIYTVSLFLLSATVGFGQDKKPRDTSSYPHQLRIGIDLSRPLMHALSPERFSYEVQADWAFRREVFGVVEGGFGGYTADYTDLKYKSTNAFIRLGVDRNILRRLKPSDWDGGIFGLRYGFAAAQRSAADYAVGSPVWGYANGSEAAQNYYFHWVELTGGMRLELFRNVFAGWNIRGKFMITNLETGDLKPSYIAGFGSADKSTAFDFNIWLLYAMRWQRK